ncbi:hypothetical protein GCM10009527_048870 [Actinomadura nitritigenes]|uniref:DUF4190 domain-containing protein n=1 Tax=Actinomadura nitritigenes TaxID=134602 RepID=A0ABS3QTU8_9ACTN|nr:DUF4190 domain-containing protein [Actinomadura nitritigenes]MBO2437412.1 DUF4190 domain-containing protein [Actinomadura nitritigenes]
MAQPPYDPYGYGSNDPYAPQPYSQPPVQHHYYGGAAPVSRGTNGMATAAMVLGLIGIVSCGTTSILAIIFGHVAQSQIKRTHEEGQGMATAGLILGYIVTGLWLIVWVFYLWLWAIVFGSAATTSTTY